MKQIIVERETLTDKSVVYNLKMGDWTFQALDEKTAYKAANAIAAAIEDNAYETVKIGSIDK